MSEPEAARLTDAQVIAAHPAENALGTFTLETYGGRLPYELPKEDRGTAIYDLITDLMHYARLQRTDPEGLVQSALRQWDHERKFRFDAETD